MPRASASLRPARRVGLAVERIGRASGWCTPPRMFIVVDLPEPFSPTRPSTWPASQRRSRRRAAPATPKKLLRQPLETRAAARPSRVSRLAAKRWRCASSDGRRQDDPALDREHRGQREAEQLQALVDDGEEQGAEDRPDHLALAAEQADAADDGGTHDVEQDALAQHRRAGLEPAGVEDGGDAGAQAARSRRPRNTTRRTGTPETAAARGLRPMANSQRP